MVPERLDPLGHADMAMILNSPGPPVVNGPVVYGLIADGPVIDGLVV